MYNECSSQYGCLTGGAGSLGMISRLLQVVAALWDLQVVAAHWEWLLGSSGGGSSLGMISRLLQMVTALWYLQIVAAHWEWLLGSSGGGSSSGRGMCRKSSNCSKAIVTGTNKCNEMLSHYTVLLPNSSSFILGTTITQSCSVSM